MENNKLNIYKVEDDELNTTWNVIQLDGDIIMEGKDIDVAKLFSYLNTNYDVSVKYIDDDEYFKYGAGAL